MGRISLLRRGGDTVVYVLSRPERELSLRADTTLAAVRVDDWNAQLSPWFAEKCFKNGEDFAGGGDDFLRETICDIGRFEEEHGIAARRRVIAGYSLAGLMAVYAMYKTDIFCSAVSASGSIWFDGFTEFAERNRLLRRDAAIYLSVGDQEKRARNPRLALVEESTGRLRDILLEQGHEVRFELNPGNHFRDGDVRLARGIDAVCSMLDGMEKI